MEVFLNFFKELLSKLPVPYLTMLGIGGLAAFALRSSDVKEYLFGPTWECWYNTDAETVIFQTETDLISGMIIVRYQLELEYDGRVFYILEIQGLYNTNEAKPSNPDMSDSEQGSKFCLILESQQSDKMKNFEINLTELLGERLGKRYENTFNLERFKINEVQIAEIHYQSSKMNKSEPMYVLVSEKETSTISKREVIMRSPNTFINLDELNLEESFYTNEEIMTIVEDCVDKIKMNVK